MLRIFSRLAPLSAVALVAACDGAARVAGASADGAAPGRAALAPACVEFNVPPAGATFGGGWSPAGAVVFVENGVRVSANPFTFLGGGTTYGYFRIEPAPAGFGAGRAAFVRFANVGFDFTALPFVPSSVTFDWRDNGGEENLGVNGALFVGELDAPPAVLGGAAVNSVVLVAAPQQGRTRVAGPVGRLWVGGAEIFLDRVCANP